MPEGWSLQQTHPKWGRHQPKLYPIGALVKYSDTWLYHWGISREQRKLFPMHVDHLVWHITLYSPSPSLFAKLRLYGWVGDWQLTWENIFMCYVLRWLFWTWLTLPHAIVRLEISYQLMETWVIVHLIRKSSPSRLILLMEKHFV